MGSDIIFSVLKGCSGSFLYEQSFRNSRFNLTIGPHMLNNDQYFSVKISNLISSIIMYFHMKYEIKYFGCMN